MATVIECRDKFRNKTAKAIHFKRTATPHEEAAAVARLRLAFPDEIRYEVRALHGETVKDVRKLFGIGNTP